MTLLLVTSTAPLSSCSVRLLTPTPLQAMREGMGSKVSNIIHGIAAFIAGLTIGLVKGWQLVMLACIPLMAGASSLMLTGMFSSSVVS